MHSSALDSGLLCAGCSPVGITSGASWLPCAPRDEEVGRDILRMELRHLRYVIAAAECGSFRRAAKALGIHESAISRRIRDVEDEIGAALFIRQPSGVSLTIAGQRFFVRARRALNHVSHAAKDAAAVGRGEKGRVRVGIFTSLASGFLADLLRQYVESNPAIRTQVIEGGPAGHIAAIQRHELDVAFLTGEPRAEGCDLTHFWSEKVYVALPRNDHLARKRAINWSDLRDRHFIVSEVDPGPEIHDYLVKHLAELGHHPSVERHVVGRDNLMQLVKIGQGLTLTSEATIGTRFPGVVFRSIANEILPFCCIWSVYNDNPALRRLLSLARALSKPALHNQTQMVSTLLLAHGLLRVVELS